MSGITKQDLVAAINTIPDNSMSRVQITWATTMAVDVNSIKIGDFVLCFPQWPDNNARAGLVIDKFDQGLICLADGGVMCKLHGSTPIKITHWT